MNFAAAAVRNHLKRLESGLGYDVTYNSSGDTPDSQLSSSSEEPDIPDIELSTDFERSVYDIAKENGGKLISIETIAYEGTDESNVLAAVLCENDEDVVNKIGYY